MIRLTDEELDLLERSLDAIENEYRPTCESANYGSGCPGPTDATLDFWRRAADAVPAMIEEIRERRAQDLTAEDVETLRVLRDNTSEFGILAPKYVWRSRDEEQDADAAWTRRAIALLDKLLARGNR